METLFVTVCTEVIQGTTISRAKFLRVPDIPTSAKNHGIGPVRNWGYVQSPDSIKPGRTTFNFLKYNRPSAAQRPSYFYAPRWIFWLKKACENVIPYSVPSRLYLQFSKNVRRSRIHITWHISRMLRFRRNEPHLASVYIEWDCPAKKEVNASNCIV